MNYLPSKKAALFVAVLIVLTVGGLWYAGGINKRSGESNTKNQTPSTTDQRLLTASSPEEIEQSIEPLVIPQIASGQKIPTFDLADYVKVYGEKNLILTKDNSPESLRAYGLAVATALKPFSLPRENEVNTFLRAVDNKTMEDIASLKNSREVKQVVLTELLKIKTPTEARDLQLSIVNSVSAQIGILKNMEQAFTNPILALQSATFFPSEQMRFYRVVASVNEFFALRKIIFSESEKTVIVSDAVN